MVTQPKTTGLIRASSKVTTENGEENVMPKNLKEVADEAVYFVMMIMLFVMAYIEEAYSWLRYRRSPGNSLQDVE